MIDFYETLDRGTETVIFHNKNSFGKEIVRNLWRSQSHDKVRK